MWNVRGRHALFLVAFIPLSVAAQEPTEPDPSSPVLGPGWSASPLERLLERSIDLELTPEQMERLQSAVERWNSASAEPLSTLQEGLEGIPQSLGEGRRQRRSPRGGARGGIGSLDEETRAEVREAMWRLRELRQEQMTTLREVLTEDQLQLLRREMRSAREGRPHRWGPDRPGPRRPGWTPRHRFPS